MKINDKEFIKMIKVFGISSLLNAYLELRVTLSVYQLEKAIEIKNGLLNIKQIENEIKERK